jgi:hypothetical protein
MDEYTRAVSGQRFGKHVPAETGTKVKMVQQKNDAANTSQRQQIQK